MENATKNNEVVEISNLDDNTVYIALNKSDCKGGTDWLAYSLAVNESDVITVGCIVARPLQRREYVLIGDTVMWSGCWGTEKFKPAKVDNMTLTEGPRQKHGKEVNVASWKQVDANLILFGLDNSKWAYSEQIRKIS